MIRTFTMADYEAALALWRATPGLGVTAADEADAMVRFLERNTGLSFVAEMEGALAGTALCGHDGRRGYLYHVVVRSEYRGRGIGAALVQACRAALHTRGVDRCHVFVFTDNAAGNGFWSKLWRRRNDIVVYTADT